MRKAVALALVAVYVAGNLLVSPASALPQFKKAFEEKYVTNCNNDEFKAAFKSAGCNVCHVKGAMDKKARNAYGVALAKLTGGHCQKELDEAFSKVEEQKSGSGKSYGDLIKAGKLPAGN